MIYYDDIQKPYVKKTHLAFVFEKYIFLKVDYYHYFAFLIHKLTFQITIRFLTMVGCVKIYYSCRFIQKNRFYQI